MCVESLTLTLARGIEWEVNNDVIFCEGKEKVNGVARGFSQLCQLVGGTRAAPLSKGGVCFQMVLLALKPPLLFVR